jgi:hypothetical protein
LSRRDWLMPVAWGSWVVTLAMLMLIWSGDAVAALLGGAGLAALTIGLARAIFSSEAQERSLTRTSAAPPLIAAGMTVAVNGVAFGPWLLLIGAELAAFGAYVLIRDRRSSG